MSRLLQCALVFGTVSSAYWAQTAFAVVSSQKQVQAAKSSAASSLGKIPSDCCLAQTRPYGAVLESLAAQEIRIMQRAFLSLQDLPEHELGLLPDSGQGGGAGAILDHP